MHYRRLGKTERKVSVVGVGTWQFGGEWGRPFTQSEVDAILDTAAAEGINLIDTAECYGDHLSEQLIGNYLSRRQRDDWLIATKFGHHFAGHFDRQAEWQPASVLRQLEDSLRALKTERIDLYQFHSGTDEVFFNDELWQLLADQQRAGKIGHLGVSIAKEGNSRQVAAAAGVGAEVIQLVYNRLDQRAEQQSFPLTSEHDLGVLARVPLASGYLSGKYKPDAVFAADDVRSRHDAEETSKLLRKVANIRQQEVPDGIPLSRWALAWCLTNPSVAGVIPGCKNPQQVTENARATELIDESGNWVEF